MQMIFFAVFLILAYRIKFAALSSQISEEHFQTYELKSQVRTKQSFPSLDKLIYVRVIWLNANPDDARKRLIMSTVFSLILILNSFPWIFFGLCVYWSILNFER
jgi:hypothetical protein